ncbi:hypothetical protein OSI29_20490, partial [Mycobacterium ulcerans]|nr:hypothetical protein [Mycobacterium ulcerans]MEB4004223.1 hypothetical protein [Mycobacterium ulcerans]MEB4029041.1 hypothetical protein [Mycobacterium ulcerans]MEB4045564.1 hypothetical protein [Mycobacterium ulcerans]MEB4049720.1 hypothetical protein [Mycobacterium ulcerans]
QPPPRPPQSTIPQLTSLLINNAGALRAARTGLRSSALPHGDRGYRVLPKSSVRAIDPSDRRVRPQSAARNGPTPHLPCLSRGFYPLTGKFFEESPHGTCAA